MLHPDAEARYGISYDQELSEEEAQVVSLGVHAIFCRSLRGGGALPAMKLWIAKANDLDRKRSKKPLHEHADLIDELSSVLNRYLERRYFGCPLTAGNSQSPYWSKSGFQLHTPCT